MRLTYSLLAVAAGVALCAPAAAFGAREVPVPGPLPPAGELGTMHDRVLSRPGASMARAVARAAGAAYRTRDGYSVEVETSPSYPRDPAADQALVDFLDSHLHGPELGELRVYVGTPSEVARLCGGGDGVVACYAADEQRMYVPGEASHGVPLEYAITHEYGHHLATWQDNDPWLALDWGTKRWASYAHVCSRVVARRLFPGDEGAHYLADPGEAFADAYAHYHYRSAPWQFSRLLRPDAGAYRAIERDVRDPWTGPRRASFAGRLGARRPLARFRLRLRLDGDVTLRLRGPRGSNYDLSVRWGRELVGATHRRGSHDAAGLEWCRTRGSETATISVLRRRGSGPFRLNVRYPG